MILEPAANRLGGTVNLTNRNVDGSSIYLIYIFDDTTVLMKLELDADDPRIHA